MIFKLLVDSGGVTLWLRTMSIVLNPELDFSTKKPCFSVGGLPPEYESYIRQVDHNAGRWMFSIDWPGEYHVSEESYGSPEEALAAVEQFLKAR